MVSYHREAGKIFTPINQGRLTGISIFKNKYPQIRVQKAREQKGYKISKRNIILVRGVCVFKWSMCMGRPLGQSDGYTRAQLRVKL